eukprot:6293861-Prymnesium_polylepis.2
MSPPRDLAVPVCAATVASPSGPCPQLSSRYHHIPMGRAGLTRASNATIPDHRWMPQHKLHLRPRGKADSARAPTAAPPAPRGGRPLRLRNKRLCPRGKAGSVHVATAEPPDCRCWRTHCTRPHSKGTAGLTLSTTAQFPAVHFEPPHCTLSRLTYRVASAHVANAIPLGVHISQQPRMSCTKRGTAETAKNVLESTTQGGKPDQHGNASSLAIQPSAPPGCRLVPRRKRTQKTTVVYFGVVFASLRAAMPRRRGEV